MIKIVDVAPNDWMTAARIGERFMEEYPDRKLGLHNGVAYIASGKPPFYVYRVKSGVVVRGQISEGDAADNRRSEMA